MSIEQVIEAGKGVTIGNDNTIFMVAIVLCGLSVLFLLASFFTASVELVRLSVACLICGLFSMMLSSVPIPTDKSIHEYEVEEKKWEENYVLPYTKTLPEQKMDIIYVKVGLEMKEADAQTSFIGDVSRTQLIIGYKDSEGMKTAQGMMETSFTLGDKQEPYITYKTIPVDLGHGFEAGMHNVKLYLPKSYTFTDMK